MKGSLLYYASSDKSNVSFVYTTSEPRDGYKAVFEAKHVNYGILSDFRVFRTNGTLATNLMDQIVTSFMPVIASKDLNLAYNLVSCFVLLSIGGIFSYKNRTVGIVIFAITAVFLYWVGFLRIPSIIVATIVVYAAFARIGGGR